MKYRDLGRTGLSVSEISFGAWAIGGAWGSVDDEQSMQALHAAIDSGVNFIDTADVYGDGRSERLVARLRRERPGETIHVATKAGRRLPAQTVDGYNRDNLTAWVDRSLQNLDTHAIDLLQLHCPPSPVFADRRVYDVLDGLVEAGKIRHYGVSVERVDEAIEAIRHPGVETVQIIFNMFRLKPADVFFPEARRRNVGVLARVPLASGLLTGKLTASSTFAPDDHRAFNREGEAFDKGETFSGVPYAVGLAAVDDLRAVLASAASRAAGSEDPAYKNAGSEDAAYRAAASEDPAYKNAGSEDPAYRAAGSEDPAYKNAGSEGAAYRAAASEEPSYRNATLAQFALRWTLMFGAVSCAIPGARTPEQARANAAASDLPPIAPYEMRAIEQIYDRRIRPHVHRLW